MRLTFRAMLSSVLLMLALPAAAQQVIITGPPADGPIQIGRRAENLKTGTGVLRGRIVAADTGRAIRRAQVRISGPDIGLKSALTDGNGRYEFKELPAGRFNVSVSKAGYVNMQYGENRPFEPGRPIEMKEAEVLEKVDVALPRGSVIAGHVLDEFGDPVTDAMVGAMRMQFVNGRRRLVNAGRMAQTDDLGQFRLYGLPPGDYYVSATYRGMEAISDLIGPSGGPVGSTPDSGYAPTYYPAAANPAAAQRVSVAVGQELNGIDVNLQPVKLARITGTAVGSDGRPISSGMVMLMPASRETMFFMGGTSTRTGKDGQFTLHNVAPGDYTLQVRSAGPMVMDDGGGAMMFAMSVEGPGGADERGKAVRREFASVPVSVTGENVAGLVVVTTPGVSASGRVVFDGGTHPAGIEGIRVTALAADMDAGPMMGGGGTRVNADGTFQLSGLAGTRILRTGGLPRGWSVKTVRANGIDVTDTGIEFKPGVDVNGIEIELTEQRTSVAGSVTDDHGNALKDYTVVVFAADESKWTLPMTRWTASARPDQDGHFTVDNLPAGRYFAVAVDYVADGEWSDPDWLARARPAATAFTLAPGGTQSLALKLSAF